MQPEAVSLVRLIFVGLFLVTLLLGGFLTLNYQRIFGADANVPSDNESSRAYSKVQVVMLWLHAVVLTGAFALLFH